MRQKLATVRMRRGQVVVETAIIMPVFVFLLLGLLQLSLMHQARVMAKYAAFKAVRAGSLRGAQKKVMEQAALAVLLPVAGRDSDRGALFPTNNASNLASAWNSLKGNTQEPGLPIVKVTICNPLKSTLSDPDNTDFDDPHSLNNGQPPPQNPPAVTAPGAPNSEETGGGADQQEWRNFDATKLMAQVTLYYRLYVPFANWMIFRIAFAQEQSAGFDKMRWTAYDKNMSRDSNKGSQFSNPRDGAQDQKLIQAADQRRYIMPIRASYAMRMQSNLISSNLEDQQNCKIPWKKAN